MPSALSRAYQQSRAAFDTLSEAATRAVVSALRDHAERLAASVRRMPAGPGRTSLDETRRLAVRAYQQLHGELERAIAEGRQVAFQTVLRIQTEAGGAAVQSALADALKPQRPSLTLQGAWERFAPSATEWRTLLAGHGTAAARDVTHIIRTALAEGVGPEELAVRLRPYVAGAESFEDAFRTLGKRVPLAKLKSIDAGAARRMRNNALRIAFTEFHRAQVEATLMALAVNPMVRAVRWTRSPNRGTQTVPDACDLYATADFYGLGRGVYPLTAFPMPPHPYCRCSPEPLYFDRPGRTPPTPTRKVSAEDVKWEPKGLTEAQARQVRQQAEVALREMGSSVVPERMTMLMAKRAPTTIPLGVIQDEVERELAVEQLARKELAVRRTTAMPVVADPEALEQAMAHIANAPAPGTSLQAVSNAHDFAQRVIGRTSRRSWTPELERSGLAYGSVSYAVGDPTGSFRLEPDIASQFMDPGTRVARDLFSGGIRNDQTRGWAWHTAIHETWHTMSPWITTGLGGRQAVWLEEGMTEYLTQQTLRAVRPSAAATERTEAPYPSFRAPVEAIAKALGREGVQYIWNKETDSERLAAYQDVQWLAVEQGLARLMPGANVRQVLIGMTKMDIAPWFNSSEARGLGYTLLEDVLDDLKDPAERRAMLEQLEYNLGPGDTPERQQVRDFILKAARKTLAVPKASPRRRRAT